MSQSDRRNQYCRIFVDALTDHISPSKISVNDLGRNEGCVIDVKSSPVEGSSIKIDGKGDVFGEIMVPHCKGSGEPAQMYLLTVGMELCSADKSKGVEGCSIDQVHVHTYEKEYSNLFGSTHIHFDCKIGGHSAHNHCIQKIAKTIVKLDEYATKNCGHS